jgi:DNA repair protein RAD16
MRADRSELVKEAAARLTSSNGGGGGGGGGRKAKSSVLLGRESIVQQLDMDAFASSTKIDAVVDEVVLIRKKDKSEKTIIFSQYNRMIDLVEAQLKLKGFQTVKLMGYMPIAQRKSVLDAFKTEPNISVILMSLKAGGEGLNLQEANHVLVLEPWWNPQVEMQAIQRAHRIGQTRDVHAVRFITEGSIEDRMLELQNKKQLIFEGAVDSNATALSQLTQEDLQFLFGGN